MGNKVLGGMVLAAVMALASGCVVRTYQLTRDRVDQDLTTGNHGYLLGQGAPVEKERKTTRDTRVIEVEIGSPVKLNKKCPQAPLETQQLQSDAGNRGYITESASEGFAQPEATGAFENYTVEKGDTLQKISKKLFNTTKKWHKIFVMNQDVLKGPNSIYPGQIIKVPVQSFKQPQENLK